MKLLIIDDNNAVRSSLRLLLSDEFTQIVTTGDPRLIPALLNAGDVDAVLLDMNFDTRNLDGSEGLFWLRRIKEMENPPAVVLITAFGDVALAVEGMKLGGEDFVTKPWDNEVIKRKLRQAVATSRSRNETLRSMEKARALEARDNRQQSMTLEEIKREHVVNVVTACGGNIKAAAEKLGINRQTLYNIINRK
ncbi:MAG: DNA-binding response regulator [Paramuribaculum sp.]|nr:DNA-binding response regulator [Paramuribaculum sp.]